MRANNVDNTVIPNHLAQDSRLVHKHGFRSAAVSVLPFCFVGMR